MEDGKEIKKGDRVLVMTVHPGFSGQKFIQSVLPKIREIREMIDSTAPGVEIADRFNVEVVSMECDKDHFHMLFKELRF